MRKIKSSFSAPLLVLVIFALLMLSRYININDLKYRDSVYLSMIILQMLIFILPGVFYMRLRGGDIAKRMHIRPLKIREMWFTFCCLCVLIFGSMIISSVYFRLGGVAGEYTLYNTFVPNGSRDVGNAIYVIITFAVIPAFTEEFIFRGVVLAEYTGYGVLTSILMSSLMFSMLHFDLRHLFLYFFCGVVISYAVYVTRSIVAGIAIHLLNNLYSLFLDGAFRNVLQNPNSYAFFVFVAVSLFLLFLLLSFGSAESLLYTAGMKGEEAPPEAQKRAGSKISFLFESIVSPPFLACVLFFLIVTLVIDR